MTAPVYNTEKSEWAGLHLKKLSDGKPCNHPRCLHHVTHPCEGCGRIAGYPARKVERFVRVIYDGNNCIMEPAAAADLIADGDVVYQTEDIFMARDQFEKLPEFNGF